MEKFRLAGAVLAALCASFYGFALQRDLKIRMDFLMELHRCLLLLGQEIIYLKTPLEEAMKRTGGASREPLASFFQAVGKRLAVFSEKGVYSVWRKAAVEYLGELPLKKADWELIGQLGKQLEGLAVRKNGEFLQVYQFRLEDLAREAREEYKNKAQLYQRLGIMGGIFLVILFL